MQFVLYTAHKHREVSGKARHRQDADLDENLNMDTNSYMVAMVHFQLQQLYANRINCCMCTMHLYFAALV